MFAGGEIVDNAFGDVAEQFVQCALVARPVDLAVVVLLQARVVFCGGRVFFLYRFRSGLHFLGDGVGVGEWYARDAQLHESGLALVEV